jgi:hypothetical protein
MGPVTAGPHAHKMERTLSELLEYGLRPVVAGPRAHPEHLTYGLGAVVVGPHTHKINACLRNPHFCISSQYAPNGTTEAQDRRVQFIRT